MTAPRDDFEIGGVRVEAGTRQTVNLPVSVLSDHTPVTMSVHIVHGRRRGPVLCVSGGVHGDEVIGVEIVRRLLKTPTLRSLRGTLLAVPIVNAFGFINRSRYLPDRRDLNRVFPGSVRGSLASRLANLFLTEIVGRSDLRIDLPSAAVHRTNYPQVRIEADDPQMAELASIFGAPIVMHSPLRRGSLRYAAKQVGKAMLLFEAGEGLRFDEISVRAGVAGVLRVMRHLEMLPSRGISKPTASPQVCKSSRWVRAPMGGLVRLFKTDGSLVQQGEVLATVSDPFGEEERNIEAPYDGVIVGRAVMPVVNEGDAVVHLGRVGSFEHAEGVIEDLALQLHDDPMFFEDEII